MPSFSYNVDKCFFSKRDTCLFVQEGNLSDIEDKSNLILSLAPKHKVTALEFNAKNNLDIEDIIPVSYTHLTLPTTPYV